MKFKSLLKESILEEADNDLNEINTGAWKNIQTRFHNFKVIADLGMRFTTNESKNRKRV